MIKIQTRIYSQAYKTNIYGTRNICEIAKIKNVKKFFYFSVLQVYGRELLGKIKENSKINCDNDYSLTHYLAENTCEKYSKNSNTEFSTMRLGYMFGCPIDKKIDRKNFNSIYFLQASNRKKRNFLLAKGKHKEILFL